MSEPISGHQRRWLHGAAHRPKPSPHVDLDRSAAARENERAPSWLCTFIGVGTVLVLCPGTASANPLPGPPRPPSARDVPDDACTPERETRYRWVDCQYCEMPPAPHPFAAGADHDTLDDLGVEGEATCTELGTQGFQRRCMSADDRGVYCRQRLPESPPAEAQGSATCVGCRAAESSAGLTSSLGSAAVMALVLRRTRRTRCRR